MNCSLCQHDITPGSRAVVLTPDVGYHRGCWRLLMDVPKPLGPLERRAHRQLGRCRLRTPA